LTAYYFSKINVPTKVKLKVKMHGRLKTSQCRSETELNAIQKKADSLSKTVLALLASKKREDYSDDALDLTTKILSSNPDFYSVWNYRREILCSRLPELSTFSHGHQRIVNNDLRDRDLKLSEDCIRKNPKSCKY
jgi:geranylgeranyl transferase type-2 subunit alpha